MYINVRVNPGSRFQKIQRVNPDFYKVWLKSAPEKDEANEELIRVLAEYFNVKSFEVTLVNAGDTREKLVRIGE